MKYTTVFHFNPYLPLPGRLFEILCVYGAGGTTIETCNRDLARAAGCSAGAIPGALRTLEADGYIERVTTARGSLIIVKSRSDMPDRDLTQQPTDQACIDRSPGSGSPIPTHQADRSPSMAAERSAMPDPPHTPHNGIRSNQQRRQQHAPAEIPLRRSKTTLAQSLEVLGVHPQRAELISHQCPDRSVDEFQAQVALAAQLGKRSPIGLIVSLWSTGAQLTVPEEHHAAPHTARAPRNAPRTTSRRDPRFPDIATARTRQRYDLG